MEVLSTPRVTDPCHVGEANPELPTLLLRKTWRNPDRWIDLLYASVSSIHHHTSSSLDYTIPGKHSTWLPLLNL